jgi:excisionase family DNA binding protein
VATVSQTTQPPEESRAKATTGNAQRLGPQPVSYTQSPRPEFERLLDSEEAAALLKIHPKTLQRMARRHQIAGVQIGKLWRFRASALNEWLVEKMAG